MLYSCLERTKIQESRLQPSISNLQYFKIAAKARLQLLQILNIEVSGPEES